MAVDLQQDLELVDYFCNVKEDEEELWLFALPNSINVEKKLNGLTLSINSTTDGKVDEQYSVRVNKVNSELMPLTSTESRKLSFRSRFKGHINITKSVPMEVEEGEGQIHCVQDQPQLAPCSNDLYQRWQPFGTADGTLVKQKSKKKKKAHS